MHKLFVRKVPLTMVKFYLNLMFHISLPQSIKPFSELCWVSAHSVTHRILASNPKARDAYTIRPESPINYGNLIVKPAPTTTSNTLA